MNTLSLKPYSQQIYLSKAALMETCLVVGDDLVEVVLVLLIKLCQELGAFGCPIRLAHSQTRLEDESVPLQADSARLLGLRLRFGRRAARTSLRFRPHMRMSRSLARS